MDGEGLHERAAVGEHRVRAAERHQRRDQVDDAQRAAVAASQSRSRQSATHPNTKLVLRNSRDGWSFYFATSVSEWEDMMTPRGRPRDTEVDERVLRIAAALIFERGYAGLSIDEVAEQAGVAKTTLYRHWPTKDHLAVTVVARLQADHEITETGDIRADLVNNLDKIATALNRMRAAGGREGPSAGVAGEREPGTWRPAW
ncbi:helix-turn-helix domain-containing protein [Nonomuraea sp. NPDC050691]|uniref:TetR/AcrR family transcriptional regulator n=1 Tax=Nonomuraea sp. NPDC050691 TaxID=3155661 RepID=UPI0033CD71E7